MVRRYDGFVDTLLDAHQTGRGLWAFCRNCGHRKLVKPWDLIKDCGRRGYQETVRLTDLAKKFGCQKCGHHVTSLLSAEGLAHGYAGLGRR